jgi:hypothetical protein
MRTARDGIEGVLGVADANRRLALQARVEV